VAPIAAAAVALIAVGGALGFGLAEMSSEEVPTTVVPSGEPGQPGAYEPVAFTGQPQQVDVSASVVADTWGTETVLDVSGLTVGERYTVKLVEGDVEGATEPCASPARSGRLTLSPTVG